MRIDQGSGAARANRIAVVKPATLRDPARAPVDVVIENLSETGALLLSEGDLPVGALVSLGIAGVGIQVARIARAERGRFACEFMVPLDPSAVRVARSAETLVSVAFPRMLPSAARVAATPPPIAATTPATIETAPGSRLLAIGGAMAAILVLVLLYR